VMRNSLVRLVAPDTNEILPRGTRSSSASSAIRASFARPSVGGVVSEIFMAPAWTPVTPLFRAPGCTLTAMLHPSATSWAKA